MWIQAILVISVILHGSSKELTCPGYSAYHYDEVCIGESVCQNDRKNFTWKYLNNNDAKVIVEFNTINNFCQDVSTVILEHSEVLTKETCIGSDFGRSSVLSSCSSSFNFQAHSERNVMIKKEYDEIYQYSVCSKMNVTFNMIYEGCYRLKIMQDGENTTVCSHPMYLETNFTKDNIFKYLNISVQTFYDKKRKYMVHRVSNLKKLHASKVEIRVRLCDKNTTCKSCKEYKRLIVTLNETGEYECKKGEKSTSCRTEGENDIVCTTDYIESKQQCLWVTLYQHPCSGMGVWYKSAVHNNSIGCSWSSPVYVMSTQNETSTTIYEDNMPAVIVVAIFSCLIFIAFCIFVYVFREKFKKLIESNTGGKRESVPSLLQPKFSKNILLVYPRDCEEFMDLMTTFRRILQGFEHCKVHDIYDPDNSDIEGNFNKWLYDCLKKKNLNVILVESKCSVILQRKYIINKNIVYDNSKWTDNLFRIVLDALMHKTVVNKLQISVIRFSDFADVNDYLEGFIRYPRFAIPERMGLLLRRIFKKQHLDCTAEQYQDLEGDMTKLQEHRRRNPNYLSTLITVV